MNWRHPLVKFLLVFTTCYFIALGLISINFIESKLNTIYRNISRISLNVVLPDADIKTRIGLDKNYIRNDDVMAVHFTWTKERIEQIIVEAKKRRLQNISIPERFANYYLFPFFSVPFMFLCSLILATPIRLKQKAVSLLLGNTLLLIFLVLKLSVFVVFTISKAQIGIYELEHSNMQILQKLASAWTLGFSIMLSVFIWVMVAIRKSNLINSLAAKMRSK